MYLAHRAQQEFREGCDIRYLRPLQKINDLNAYSEQAMFEPILYLDSC